MRSRAARVQSPRKFVPTTARFLLILTLSAALSPAPAAALATPAPIRFDIARFAVEGNTLLSSSAIESLLAAYTGKGRDFGDVQRALEALEAAYVRQGFNLVSVALPEQELNEGVVRLVVTEARIGAVRVEGSRFHDEANIRRSIPGLREGETPNLAEVSASLKLANENPSKQTTLNLQRGGQSRDVDAILKVTDERAWKAIVGLDNEGNETTGEWNLGLQLQHANFANRDHVLGLQYATTLEHPERVGVYGVGYHIPVYGLGGSLDLYGNYSDVDSGTLLAGLFDLQVRGKGTSYGARFNRDLPRFGAIESKLALGLDYREYRDSIELQGIPIGNDITLRPASLAYLGTWRSDTAEASLILAGVRNIPGGKRGSQDDFDRLRAGAKADYGLLRYGLSYVHALPAGWQARASLNGQATRESLVPAEQFGAGGAGSVRGFAVREIANDQGQAASVELQTPELCARMAFISTGCRVLVFYDSAHVTRNGALPGESDRASIASVGLGLRAAIGRGLSLQLDYGYVIDAGFQSMKGDDKLHFRLSWVY